MPGRYSVKNTLIHLQSPHLGEACCYPQLTDRDTEAEKQELLAQGPKASKWPSWDLTLGSLCPNCYTAPPLRSRITSWPRRTQHALLLLPTELAQNEFPAVRVQSLSSLLSCLVTPMSPSPSDYLKGAAVLKTGGRKSGLQGPPGASAEDRFRASVQGMSLCSSGLERRQCVAAKEPNTQVNP